jgi:mono/diheme cytochrome c family protein
VRKPRPTSVANLEGKIVLGVLTLALVGATVGITLWLVDENNNRAEAAVVETGEAAETATEAEMETAAAETEATTGAETVAETEATTEAETEATTEAETEATTEAEAGGGDAAAGAEVFASAGCASCHTLADAGASGTVGPNLDEAQPDEALVVERVTNGMGAMPSFAGQLSEQQIADVAAYVSSVAGA